MKSPIVIHHPSFVIAANEELPAANTAVIAGGFTLMQPDGFEIEYGEYPHSVGVQVFDRESAQLMANELASLLGQVKRGFRGVPVYAGHPDHPDQRMAAQYPDRKARGWIKEIIVGETSARFISAYNELGKGEVEDAQWAGYSPLWLMQPVANARGRFRPVILKSMALTNNPNMPVRPLIVANEDESGQASPADLETPKTPMKPETLAKLKKLLNLADDADETALDTAVNSYCDTAAEKPAVPEKKEPPAEEKKEEEIPAAAANDAFQLAIAAANTAVENMRLTRIDFALDQLVTSGRLPLANRDATRSSLVACANEFALSAQLNTLRGSKPTLQTKLTHSADLAKEKGQVIAANDGAARSRMRQEAVEAVTKEKPGISQTLAWGIAASRSPELFAA